MKISTKFILISLVVSFVPIVTIILMARETSLFHQEDFQAAITLGMAIALCIAFICPLLGMRWLFLTQLRRIRKLCADVHSGKYSFIDLPVASDEKNAENEMVTLMREMNWMANQIHIRETRLMDTAAKIEIAKTAALQSEMHYRQLIENIGDIIFTTDLEGNITFVSKNEAGIIDYEPANLSSV
jgi:PAS domain-containing protein